MTIDSKTFLVNHENRTGQHRVAGFVKIIAETADDVVQIGHIQLVRREATMFLLCKHGDEWAEWYALSASGDASVLQAEADRLNALEYQKEHADWLERGETGAYPMPLDDPRREGYLTYFVREVADWPRVNEAP